MLYSAPCGIFNDTDLRRWLVRPLHSLSWPQGHERKTCASGGRHLSQSCTLVTRSEETPHPLQRWYPGRGKDAQVAIQVAKIFVNGPCNSTPLFMRKIDVGLSPIISESSFWVIPIAREARVTALVSTRLSTSQLIEVRRGMTTSSLSREYT